ncbi:chromaffin granule amine transporter isoform X3 [Xenopus laevis]|uniref:Chromaffin granule amine transporter isoform X3 n=1 Tax=Xenopus laevis TaxID=8355 RepID=A0A8J0UT69_XENLA|nr:chromaffin granule amine transporter isoform X3 [Xenopus laevis]
MAGCCQWMKKQWESRAPILFVIAVAMFVDCIQFTIIAPIAPALLYEIEYRNGNTTFKNSSGHYPVSSYDALSNVSHVDNSKNAPYHDQIFNESHRNHSECYKGKDFLNDENVRVGLLLAINAFVQLLTNPIVGKLINRTGYDAPMFCGFIIVFISSLMFAFANSYVLLCVARGLQGVGSAFTMVPAMGMLAHLFPDDAERGKAMGLAMSGIAVGVLAGPPFGSAMYEFVGKSSPFLVVAALAFIDGALQLCILKPTKLSPMSVPETPYRVLLTDPYIVVAAVGLCICNLSFGMLEPTIPIRMMETMCAPPHINLDWLFFPVCFHISFVLIFLRGFRKKLGGGYALCLE